MNRKFKTMDGNTAAAYTAYAFSEVAAIYPISPASVMGELTDVWSTQNQKNIFDKPVKVVEMQSEAGAAGTVHGSLTAGALTTTYTASQGLLLMLPNMYKIAGELLPNVIHVSARTIASHALSIFGDHSDIYAARQTGYAMLCSQNPQEAMDLSAAAHLSTIKSRVPFVHFFDGFRTSHEIQKVKAWDYNDLKSMVDMQAIKEFRKRALNPNNPVLRGTAQNPDIFFQARESSNPYYNAVPEIVENYFNEINKKIGTDYKLFNYYGAKDATHIIIAMGSVCDTIEETIDYLNNNGQKVGLIKVRLYRPFSINHLLQAIPETVKQITVLDRTKECGASGEPLYLDILAALKESQYKDIPTFSGRYGLSSKDTTPEQIIAVYNNNSKKIFTLGINDDVTNLSLEIGENVNTTPQDITSCKFWGLGADGTVGANKNSIKIIGDNTDLNVQAYFNYDSKKSGGVTTSHLRFGKSKIKSTYLVTKADFVACHNSSYIDKYDMVQQVKKGGTFLLNCSWNETKLKEYLPNQVKRYILENNIDFYVIDGVDIAKEIGLGGRINTILQSAFFKLTNIIPIEKAVELMKQAATNSYAKKGDEIVKMNHLAIDKGVSEIKKIEITNDWITGEDKDLINLAKGEDKDLVDFVNKIVYPISAQKGDDLPVSAFVGREDGTFPQGTAAYEKRSVAIDVPCWNSENCIQCNFCAYVCPHAVIRPTVLNEQEKENAPKDMKTISMIGMAGYYMGITISVMDCTGCGSCVNVCPGKKGEKALEMKPLQSQLNEQNNFAYGFSATEKPEILEKFKETTVKGSQYKQPLLEFSGACAGCGETPYAKLATQLFGDRMYISNATGCSSIWGGSAPSTPYTKNRQGKGPSWGNSLFEDNAEFGYGMLLAQKTLRERAIDLVKEYSNACNLDVKSACDEYLSTIDDGKLNLVSSDKLIQMLSNSNDETAKEILEYKNYLSKKSMWIFGGDGWAYDIGFGGLDHIIASGENVNILVFDTEVYSNTGGQASKSTPIGAVAQFAANGKPIKKKSLSEIAMTYGYVYVAQIAQGADMNQCIKAFVEAESYDGPSIIIAYSPCISHGIKGGMNKSQTEQKRAVEAGYWNLFRFDPRLYLKGKNPFQLDSKAPTASYKDFIMGEVRFSALTRSNPERAEELFTKGENYSIARYNHLLKLSKLYEI